jgi:hypothetical protein
VTSTSPSGALLTGALPGGVWSSAVLPPAASPSGASPPDVFPVGASSGHSCSTGALPSDDLRTDASPAYSWSGDTLPSGVLSSGLVPRGDSSSGVVPVDGLPSSALPTGEFVTDAFPAGRRGALPSVHAVPSGGSLGGAVPTGALPTRGFATGFSQTDAFPSNGFQPEALLIHRFLAGARSTAASGPPESSLAAGTDNPGPAAGVWTDPPSEPERKSHWCAQGAPDFQPSGEHRQGFMNGPLARARRRKLSTGLADLRICPHLPVDWLRGRPPGSGGGCLRNHLGVRRANVTAVGGR